MTACSSLGERTPSCSRGRDAGGSAAPPPRCSALANTSSRDAPFFRVIRVPGLCARSDMWLLAGPSARAFLIGADELARAEDVPLDGLLDFFLTGATQLVEHGVERV